MLRCFPSYNSRSVRATFHQALSALLRNVPVLERGGTRSCPGYNNKDKAGNVSSFISLSTNERHVPVQSVLAANASQGCREHNAEKDA